MQARCLVYLGSLLTRRGCVVKRLQRPVQRNFVGATSVCNWPILSSPRFDRSWPHSVLGQSARCDPLRKLPRRYADAMLASKSGRGEARLVAHHRDQFVLAMRSERFDKSRNSAVRSLPEPRARVTHASQEAGSLRPFETAPIGAFKVGERGRRGSPPIAKSPDIKQEQTAGSSAGNGRAGAASHSRDRAGEPGDRVAGRSV